MSDWPLVLLVLIDVLAVHRLTRLVTADVITVRPRRAIIRWSYLRNGHDPEIIEGDLEGMVDADMSEDPCDVPKAASLVVCRWCASVWLAAGVVVASTLAPVVWWPIGCVLALSTVATLLAGLEQ